MNVRITGELQMSTQMFKTLMTHPGMRACSSTVTVIRLGRPAVGISQTAILVFEHLPMSRRITYFS